MQSIFSQPLRFCAAAALLGSAVHAQTVRYVPADHPTIQGAIDASSNGDVIRVSPGEYLESLDFDGIDLTVESVLGPEVTVIDSSGIGRVAEFQNGSNATLSGFTLTGGRAPDGSNGDSGVDDTCIPCVGTNGEHGGDGGDGGAVLIHGANPTIHACILTENAAGDGGRGGKGGDGHDQATTGGREGGQGGTGGRGGAIHVESGSARLLQCIFRSNQSGRGGDGGIGGTGGDGIPGDFSCTVGDVGGDGGSSGPGGNGGAVSAVAGTVTIWQCVFYGNATGQGGTAGAGGPGGVGGEGLFCSSPDGPPGSPGATGVQGRYGAISESGSASISVIGSIERASSQLTAYVAANATRTYSNFDIGGFPVSGVGNIHANPQFVSAASGDFHLGASSPCIDASDSASISSLPGALVELDLDGNARFFDNPGTPNTGTTGPGGEPPLDMGAYEFGSGVLPELPAAFVSPEGSSNASGVFNDPFDSVAAGVAAANGGEVGIVGGTYAESQVTFSDPARLISVGGDVRIQ